MEFRKVEIKITNDFHNTEARLKARMPLGSDSLFITKAQARMVWKKLCGIADCVCSDDLGARPSVSGGINPRSNLVAVYVKPLKVLDGIYTSEWSDGSGRLIKERP